MNKIIIFLGLLVTLLPSVSSAWTDPNPTNHTFDFGNGADLTPAECLSGNHLLWKNKAPDTVYEDPGVEDKMVFNKSMVVFDGNDLPEVLKSPPAEGAILNVKSFAAWEPEGSGTSTQSQEQLIVIVLNTSGQLMWKSEPTIDFPETSTPVYSAVNGGEVTVTQSVGSILVGNVNQGGAFGFGLNQYRGSAYPDHVCIEYRSLAPPPVLSGNLEISKVVTGNPTSFVSPNYEIVVDCSDNNFDQTITVAAGASQTINNIPENTTCIVTEPTQPIAPAGYSYEVATFNPVNASTVSGVTITANATVSVVVTNPLTPTLPPAKLTINKTSSTNTAVASGDVITFTVTVSNPGEMDATGVKVLERLSPKLSYISDDSGGNFNTVTGIWDVGTVNAGGNRVLNIQVRVN